MIVRANQPERVVIGADTRLLILSLKSNSAFESYQHKDLHIRLKKHKEEWRMTAFAHEKNKIYFDLKDTTAMQYRGLYKAEVWAENCIVDKLEIVKGASYQVKAETKDDACIDGKWDECCPVEPPKRCCTTKEYVCGCECKDLRGAQCPACLETVVIASIRELEGY